MQRSWIHRAIRVAALLSTLPLAQCRAPRTHEQPAEHAPVTSIADVIARHAPELMTIEGVVGVYEGETSAHTPCIRIMVARRTPALDARLPKQLEGHPVEIEATGVIRPMGGGR